MMRDTVVLCYHAVSVTWPADLSVRPDRMREQLTLLRDRGYRGVTFSDALIGPPSGRRVAVTFDDAYRSVAHLAKPILDELGYPGTVFAVTDHVADGRPLAWMGTDHWTTTEHAGELAGLDADGLLALQDAGWEIGSHTASHPHLTRLDDDDLDHELTSSREALEALVGRACPTLAYPYGDVDDRVLAATARAGYRWAAALPSRWLTAMPLEWPRVGVYHRDDLRRFKLKASPHVRALRRRLHR